MLKLLNLKNKYEAKKFERFSQVNFLELDKNLSNRTWWKPGKGTVCAQYSTYLQTKDKIKNVLVNHLYCLLGLIDLSQSIPIFSENIPFNKLNKLKEKMRWAHEI